MDSENTQQQTEVVTTTKQKTSIAIPIAIFLGFVLVAVAIFFSGAKSSVVDVSDSLTGNTPPPEETTTGPIRPVDENDHIRGNPNAPIVIVEYSDYDCPFCKNYHATMNQVMDNYGTTGQVAWVFRQFPIEQLHPSSPRVAAASECVAKLAGNEGFWTFSDLAFGERTTNEPTNLSRLTEFAETAGADASAFEACLKNGDTQAAVEEDYNDAIQAGAKGTPHSVVTIAGQQGVINGAQPYEVVSQIIDNLITQMESGAIEEAETADSKQ